MNSVNRLIVICHRLDFVTIMPIEVIVASLPRTGTLSMKEALEKLGFTKTMHMLSCRNDTDIRAAWKEIYENHLEKKWTSQDWQNFFEVRFPDYVAGTDSPFSDFAIEIAQAYPNAKVFFNSQIKSFCINVFLCL